MSGDEVVKSIADRIQEYKYEFLEKQRQIRISNPGFDIQNSKTSFFVRLESNKDIGILFSLPNL